MSRLVARIDERGRAGGHLSRPETEGGEHGGLRANAYRALRAPSGQRDLYVSHDGSSSFVSAQSSFPEARYASTRPSLGDRFAYVDTSEVRLTVDSGRTWSSLALPDARSGRAAAVALDAGAWRHLVQGGTAYRTKVGP